MERKIIKQGHNTMTITLPSAWVKNFNLRSGDKIDLHQRENGLFLTTERKDEKLKTSFDLDGLDIPVIWKYFMVLYREGYDEIKVNFNPQSSYDNPYKYITQHSLDKKYQSAELKISPFELIQQMSNRFIGFEVIEQHKDYCIIRDMSILSSKEFDSSVRRVFLLLNQMISEILEAVEKNDYKLVEHIHDTDINVDKFYDYCVRVINKTGFKESKKASLIFSTLFILEMLGDELKSIGNHIASDHKDLSLRNLVEITRLVSSSLIYLAAYTTNSAKRQF